MIDTKKQELRMPRKLLTLKSLHIVMRILNLEVGEEKI